MPSVAANNLIAAFGDFQAGYVVIDKRKTVLLRDPYSRKGWVQFYLSSRVHGAPTDSNAIKVLKCATS
jgi:HK97 family phage major capsid protein